MNDIEIFLLLLAALGVVAGLMLAGLRRAGRKAERIDDEDE